VANTIDPLIQKLVARGLLALRQQARMARMVNRGYEPTPGAKMSTVSISVPAAVAVTSVTPAATPPSTADTVLGEVQVVVDQWKEAAFYLSDKDMTQIDAQANFLPMQASEAIKAIANDIDGAIWALYKDVHGYAGVPGTTPFATDTREYQLARKALNEQLAPMDPRYMVINTDAEANALGLRAFQDVSFSGSIDGIVNGEINRKLGASWSMSQNAPRHTTAAATAGTIALDDSVARAVGTKTLHMDGFSVKPEHGDVFRIAGDDTYYTVQSSTTLAGTDSDVTFEPGLKVAIPAADGNEVVTFEASHDVNLLFHPMAFALVTRPFEGADPFNLGKFFFLTDPVSGLTLRLEVTREHKRTRFAYDVLYGVKTVRRELGARLAG
jgi:hypothetical protein